MNDTKAAAVITTIDGRKCIVARNKIVSLEPYSKETGAAKTKTVSKLYMQGRVDYILDNTVDHYAYLLA